MTPPFPRRRRRYSSSVKVYRMSAAVFCDTEYEDRSSSSVDPVGDIKMMRACFLGQSLALIWLHLF